MATILITIIHVIVCLALILIVLLQTGKGAGMGATFGGGGSQTLFGSSGGSTFLSKATTGAISLRLRWASLIDRAMPDTMGITLPITNTTTASTEIFARLNSSGTRSTTNAHKTTVM